MSYVSSPVVSSLVSEKTFFLLSSSGGALVEIRALWYCC